MESGVIFAVTAFFLGATVSYLILEFRAYNARQEVLENAFKTQTELTAAKKALRGCKKYSEYLAAASKAVCEHANAVSVSVLRDHVHVENIPKDSVKLKENATVIIHYTLDFKFGLDLRPDNFEILDTPLGIDVKVHRPILLAVNALHTVSVEIPTVGVLLDEDATTAEIQAKFAELAPQIGSAMASEEGIRSICRVRLLEFLHDFLVRQPGVQQAPAIMVNYK